MTVTKSLITDCKPVLVGQLLTWCALVQMICIWVLTELDEANAWVARTWAVVFSFRWTLKIFPLIFDDWLMKLWVKYLIISQCGWWLWSLPLRKVTSCWLSDKNIGQLIPSVKAIWAARAKAAASAINTEVEFFIVMIVQHQLYITLCSLTQLTNSVKTTIQLKEH